MSRLARTLAFSVVLGIPVARQALAQDRDRPGGVTAPPSLSPRGIWSGLATMGGRSQRMVLAIDSGATGWRGMTIAPDDDADSIRVDRIELRSDSLVYQVVVAGTTVTMRGRILGDVYAATIWIGDSSGGELKLTRTHTGNR